MGAHHQAQVQGMEAARGTPAVNLAQALRWLSPVHDTVFIMHLQLLYTEGLQPLYTAGTNAP
jgi:hypothetical protein